MRCCHKRRRTARPRTAQEMDTLRRWQWKATLCCIQANVRHLLRKHTSEHYYNSCSAVSQTTHDYCSAHDSYTHYSSAQARSTCHCDALAPYTQQKAYLRLQARVRVCTVWHVSTMPSWPIQWQNWAQPLPRLPNWEVPEHAWQQRVQYMCIQNKVGRHSLCITLPCWEVLTRRRGTSLRSMSSRQDWGQLALCAMPCGNVAAPVLVAVCVGTKCVCAHSVRQVPTWTYLCGTRYSLRCLPTWKNFSTRLYLRYVSFRALQSQFSRRIILFAVSTVPCRVLSGWL